VNGAISYMPNIFGLMMAGHIIQTLLNAWFFKLRQNLPNLQYSICL
jgi:hypothetical protein